MKQKFQEANNSAAPRRFLRRRNMTAARRPLKNRLKFVERVVERFDIAQAAPPLGAGDLDAPGDQQMAERHDRGVIEQRPGRQGLAPEVPGAALVEGGALVGDVQDTGAEALDLLEKPGGLRHAAP